MNLCCELFEALRGRTFATAESCTGGGIGAAFTSVPGSSAVYKGGVISYTNWVKEYVLGVNRDVLQTHGAVSEQVAGAMAVGVRRVMQSDMAVSVTGIAGPGTDDFNTPVGTVYIGFSDAQRCFVQRFVFSGDRETIRKLSVEAAIKILIDACENNI